MIFTILRIDFGQYDIKKILHIMVEVLNVLLEIYFTLIQIILDQRLLKMNDYKHIHNYASLYHTYNLHTKIVPSQSR